MHLIPGLCWALLLTPLPGGQDTLSLAYCRQSALVHNQQIQIATENRQAARHGRLAARTTFFPSFNFVGSYSRMQKRFQYTQDFSQDLTDIFQEIARQNPNLINSDDFFRTLVQMGQQDQLPTSISQKIGARNNYLLNIGLTQPLYTGGKIREQYKISQHYERMARANQKRQTIDIMHQTDERYWQVIAARAYHGLAVQYMEMIGRHIRDLENYLQEGLITPNELLKAKVKYNEARVNRLKTANGLRLAKMALAQLIGWELHRDFAVKDSLQGPFDTLVTNGLYQQALQQRPEIKMLDQSVQMSTGALKISRARYFPNLLLTANYISLNPNPYNGFQAEFGHDFNLGLTCQWELFNWHQRGHQVAAARHQQTICQLQLAQLRELIALEVEQGVQQVNESAQRVSLTSLARSQAAENLRVTEDNFSEGMVKSAAVLEAQTLWQQARLENITSQVEYKTHRSQLTKILGRCPAVSAKDKPCKK